MRLLEENIEVDICRKRFRKRFNFPETFPKDRMILFCQNLICKKNGLNILMILNPKN